MQQDQSNYTIRIQELYDAILECPLMDDVVTEETIREFQDLLNQARPCNEREWYAYYMSEPLFQNNGENKWNVRNAFKECAPYLFLWMQPVEVVFHFGLGNVVYINKKSAMFDCVLQKHFKYEQFEKERKPATRYNSQKESPTHEEKPVQKVSYPTINVGNGVTYAQVASQKTTSERWSNLMDEEESEPITILKREKPVEKVVETKKVVEKVIEKPVETKKVVEKPVECVHEKEMQKEITTSFPTDSPTPSGSCRTSKTLSTEDMDALKKFSDMYEKMNEEAQKIKKFMEKLGQ